MTIRGFWEHLAKPVIGLAPMDGVSDAAFRYIVAKYGRPSLTITEFTAAEGIRVGAVRVLEDFRFSPLERPVVAQIFGADPSAFTVAASVAAALGFDGIDVNMGCPAKNVTQRGAGAALIQDPERALQILAATRQGIDRWYETGSLEACGIPTSLHPEILSRREALGNPAPQPLPLSVKTRLGYEESTIESWIRTLSSHPLAALTIHGRTLKQLYSGSADWEAIARGARIGREAGILVLGNGDVQSLEDARHRITTYGVDGVLIGRASFGNPWLFQEHEASWEERRAVALEHARYLWQITNGHAFVRIRKHLVDYCKGFEGAADTRRLLMRTETLTDVEAVLG